MVWLLISVKFGLRNMRSMTEFASFVLSEYPVGTWLVGFGNKRSNESAISLSKSLWDEWKENSRFQLLFLMLKSAVMIKTL